MKKIINNGFVLFVCLLISCGSKEKKVETDEVTAPVATQIVGVGKVLPKEGIITLSVSEGRKVVKLYKKLGNQVHAGEALFSMERVSDELGVQQAKAAEHTASAELDASELDIEKEKIKLTELKQQWATSKKLFAQQAETREKTMQDSINYASQIVVVQQKEKAVQAQRTALKEKALNTAAKRATADDFIYRAPKTGQLIRFDVSLGSILSAANSFGELAPEGEVVVEAELDEYYAQQIKLDQAVDIVLVGQSDVIARGRVSFINNALQNKSILYEQVGEGQDRRVRRFTVSIEGDPKKLLINQKVECKIHL
jgi:multidrug resistance efflux pump